MTGLGVVKLVGDIAFLAAAVGVTAFAVLYGLRSSWKATTAGRVTLGFMAVVAAIMDSAVLFGLWPGHEWERLTVRAVLFWLLVGGIAHLIAVLLRAQRCDRHVRRPAASKEG